MGRFATIYTDSQTRAYEAALKDAGMAAMAVMGLEPTDVALSVRVRAYMPIPPSWSMKKQAAAFAGDLMPTSGIDLDNIVKMLDGLNYQPPRHKGDKVKRPIVWQNDSQIVNMHAMKFYSDRPRLEIEVYRW